jgi:DNA helicase-2/ATP-dependent DNA helicase PcrA
MDSLDTFLETLNPVQKEAVLHVGNPLLILAGAGSGKTRVIIGKIAYLIARQGIDPESILAVTFTNKAAEEMRTRAEDLDPRAHRVMIKTFHSFGAWLLRRNSLAAGLHPQFTIYDTDDQLSLLTSLVPDMNRNQLRSMVHEISRAKDLGVTPSHGLDSYTENKEFKKIYRTYEKRLREIGNADFGDLILLTKQVLTQEPVIRHRLQDRFQVILVDEYQDSNTPQDQLLSLLAGPSSYVCVVGDDDQSIYRFRGAEVANILQFPSQFPGADTIRLEQNYRSTPEILALASAVVSHNETRLGKELWTENPSGPLPKILYLPDSEDEPQAVLSLIQSDQDQGLPFARTAILYRTNAQSRSFETQFIRANIPYRIIGTLRFYEREEIKDSLAYLKLLANPRDDVSFRRIINKPSRGLGNAALGKIADQIHVAQGDWIRATQQALPNLSAKAGRGAKEFCSHIQDLQYPPSDGESLAAWVSLIIQQSGLAEYHKEQDSIAGTQKLQNLDELINAASLYPNSLEGLLEFLEGIELDSSRETLPEHADALTLITMHNTKGLEFDRVICTGMEEGLFPRNPNDPGELEEERRLFYVAATRAREELVFTSCSQRKIHGRTVQSLPSRFLQEIPRTMVTMEKIGATRSAYSVGYHQDEPWEYGTQNQPKPRISYDGSWGRSLDQEFGGTSRSSKNTIKPNMDQYWPSEDQDYEEETQSFSPGDRIQDHNLGIGEVIKVNNNGRDTVVLVKFPTGQIKTFIPKYTPLEKVAE